MTQKDNPADGDARVSQHYIRKMSRTERMFFMNPSCTVRMAARINGTVDEGRLRNALSRAARCHPMLLAKVGFDENHDAWFATGDTAEIPLEVIARHSEHQWVEEIRERARVPFDIRRGPLIRCVLLRSAEASDLIIFCNHSICDGMALAILVRDILDSYADPSREVVVLDPPDALDVRKHGFSLQRLAIRFFSLYANAKWRKNPYRFGPDDYTALYSAYWEGRKPGFVLFEFDKEESACLHESCRDHGVTIGSAVTAACIAAYHDTFGDFSPRQQFLSVPYDLRTRTNPPPGDVFCFFVGSIRVPYTYNSHRLFWDNARELHGAVHSRLADPERYDTEIPGFDPSLIDAFSAFGLFADRLPSAYTRTATMQRFIRDTGNMVFTLVRKVEKSVPLITSSNLGRIDIPDSSGEVSLDRLVFLPSASEVMPLVLGGVGAGSKMVFSLSYADPPAKTGISPEPAMIRVRNRALEYLGFPEKCHQEPVEEPARSEIQ